jgi:hypothetical protein
MSIQANLKGLLIKKGVTDWLENYPIRLEQNASIKKNQQGTKQWNWMNERTIWV